jgi:outer membrane protein assembly factor BamA
MRSGVVVAALFLFALPSHAQCLAGHDHRDDKMGGVIIQDIVVTGTHTLGSSEASAITASLTGSCFDDDRSEIEEWLRAVFQDRGYFQVEVQDLRIKAADPLGTPKPVNLEAEVEEGPRCRLGSLQFQGNHAFEGSQLRTLFLRV